MIGPAMLAATSHFPIHLQPKTAWATVRCKRLGDGNLDHAGPRRLERLRGC
jgi:hypothetical protein